jgi:ABC-2 type transport system ATP-binding protein
MCTNRPPISELRGVSKRFGAVAALDDVSLVLQAGQLTAMLGPNGAGKTTAVRLMLGLTPPSCGSVRLYGADPNERRVRVRTGVMLQVSRMPDTLTPREHLALFRSYYPSPRPLADVLDLAGIPTCCFSTNRRWVSMSNRGTGFGMSSGHSWRKGGRSC